MTATTTTTNTNTNTNTTHSSNSSSSLNTNSKSSKGKDKAKVNANKNHPPFKVSPRPPFPLPGSTISDGKYFSLGKLGRGTFCEINKVVDLSYHHRHHNHHRNRHRCEQRSDQQKLRNKTRVKQEHPSSSLQSAAAAASSVSPKSSKSSSSSRPQAADDDPNPNQSNNKNDNKSNIISSIISSSNNKSSNKSNKIIKHKLRICAAKIELSSFANSGLLEVEANVLRFLSDNMNHQTPYFCDFILPIRGGASDSNNNNNNNNNNGSNNNNNSAARSISAIVMEYLPGEDMHQLRDRHSQISLKKAQQHNKSLQKQIQTSSSASASQSPRQSPVVVPPIPTSSQNYRRLKLSDAVYLCADVILPLLQSMHDCGMIHRDVKPSNIVRNGIDEYDKTFKLVDFGLSKSFVVPKNSTFADSRFVWNKTWYAPTDNINNNNNTNSNNNSNNNNEKENNFPIGCMRKERPKAEFRGTSMYASLRVHQEYEYCRRDDIWGLMYVFCDLVSGGLPWMGYAANRERAMCQRFKEWVQGERLTFDDNPDSSSNNNTNNNDDNGADDGDESEYDSSQDNDDKVQQKLIQRQQVGKKKITNDRVEELLKGANHHLARHKRDAKLKKQEMNTNNNSNTKPINPKNIPVIPPPLAMSKDEIKLNALRKAFAHLAELKYEDEPDYNLIKTCFYDFIKVEGKDNDKVTVESEVKENVMKEDDIVPNLNWKQPTQQEIGKRKWERIGNNSINSSSNANGNGNGHYNNRDRDIDETPPCTRQALSFRDTDDIDPLSESMLNEADNIQQINMAQQQLQQQQQNASNDKNNNNSNTNNDGNGASEIMDDYLSHDSINYSEIQDLERLPLQLQFHLAQVEYNASHPTTIPIHLAFRDWMKLASSLVYDEWDTAKYERGDHRSNKDGYRRVVLQRIAQQCLDAAKSFDNFSNRDCFYFELMNDNNNDHDGNVKKEEKVVEEKNDVKLEDGNHYQTRRKRRKICAKYENGQQQQQPQQGTSSSLSRNDNDSSSSKSCFLAFSKVFCALKGLIQNEKDRNTAPPPILI